MLPFHSEVSEGTLPEAVMSYAGFMLSKTAQHVTVDIDAVLKPFNIHARHYGVMLLLKDGNALAQVEIGKKLRIDRTTIVKLVDDLEKLSYARRDSHPRDRRAYLIALTEDGEGVMQQAKPLLIDVEQQFFNVLNEDEKKTLFELLAKLVTSKEE